MEWVDSIILYNSSVVESGYSVLTEEQGQQIRDFIVHTEGFLHGLTREDAP